MIANSTSLRYNLALSEHGMCDGLSNPLSKAEKLELLIAHAAAWRSLDSARPETADLVVGWSAPMAVSGNVLVFAKEVSGPAQDHRRERERGDEAEQVGLRPPTERHMALLVLRVPSALRRVEAAHWVLSLPAVASEMCIDASQDLLIYVLYVMPHCSLEEVNHGTHAFPLLGVFIRDGAFHVRTLSTGAVYPLVEHRGFFGVWNGSRRFEVFNVCVCGDFVAAGTGVSFISVWNWKTGQHVRDQVRLLAIYTLIGSQNNSFTIAKITEVRFSSFDFLDEHHILYSMSNDDRIYVYDLRRPSAEQQQPQQKEQEREADTKPVGFQLALPPIHRMTTSRYIQVRRNALPSGTAPPYDTEGGNACGSSSPPPFHADPRERLIVLRIATSPVERGEEQFELHAPARALIDRYASAIAAQRRRHEGRVDGDVNGDSDADVEANAEALLPWSAWRDAVRTTPPQKVPYVIPARMINYGMRVVSHPPNWEEGVLHIDSYRPRSRTREAGESANAEVVGARAGGGGMCGTRQAIGLPGDAEAKAGLLSVLCEDGLLCYKVRTGWGRFLRYSI